MTVDMNKYDELLQQFGVISHNHINGEALENLKEKYRDEIHSKRVLKNIVNISSLLQVLKKRGVLQYNDIGALNYINNEYVRDESIKRHIDDLITNYIQWKNENSASINFLYNSGKSNALLNSHENIPETLLEEPESAYLHNNIDENLQTSTEDMAKKSLLKNESLNNLNIRRNINETDRNSFYKINLCPLQIHKKRSTIVLMILIILIFILIGIIWILIKLSHGSAAVVPGHPSTQAASEQPQLNMPFYMASTSAGYSTSTFSANHTQIYSTSTVPPVNREYELRQIVVKELSKKIGNYWKDVCRGLDINENTIDEITIEYSQEPPGQKYEKMFKKGMSLYFSEPRAQWKVELLKALKAAKRVDLQERAQEIIHNHSYL